MVEEELAIVWRREMLSGAYVPHWVDVHTALGAVRAITFVINRAHERYARFLPDDRVAEVIAAAEGFLGPCADYLINTVDHLAQLGIHDRPLEQAAPAGPGPVGPAALGVDGGRARDRVLL